MSLAMCTYKNYVLEPEPDVVYIKDSNNEQVEVSIKTEEELEETIKKVLEENIMYSNDIDNIINTDKSKDNNKTKENDRKTEKEIIDKYKSRFYSMQGSYSSKISSMVATAKKEYYGIPEDERTSSAKVKIGLKYYDKARALEKECDSKVDGLLNSMEKELVDNNYSTKTIELIKNYYKNQKSSQKQLYMSQIK